MRAIILIPARYASSRYPGKPLVVLKGADGEKTLIQRTWETGMAVPGVDRVLVATDDDRIADAVQGFGGEVVMTSEDCANGTERCAAAIARMGVSPEIVVNLQGDAPLTPPWFLEDLIAGLRARPDLGVATPVLRCDAVGAAAVSGKRRRCAVCRGREPWARVLGAEQPRRRRAHRKRALIGALPPPCPRRPYGRLPRDIFGPKTL